MKFFDIQTKLIVTEPVEKSINHSTPLGVEWFRKRMESNPDLKKRKGSHLKY
jgi:hypothetical protein